GRGRSSIGGEPRVQARTAAKAAVSGRNRPVVEPLIEAAMTGRARRSSYDSSPTSCIKQTCSCADLETAPRAIFQVIEIRRARRDSNSRPLPSEDCGLRVEAAIYAVL